MAGLASGIIVAIHPDTADAMIEDVVQAHGRIQGAQHDDTLLLMARQDLWESILKWTDTFSGGDFSKLLVYDKMIDSFSGNLIDEIE